ncbi:hypothetical protein ATERTT37_007225 [Aspergillus terreus]
MPVAVQDPSTPTIRGGHEDARPRIAQPLDYSGTLDSYTHNDLTPVIGREYHGLQVADILKSENCERVITDLAVTSSELGDQISVISSEKQKKGGGLTHQLSDTSRFASVGWHTDISFERVPSDYAMLKIHTLPETGGDTLWASGYEIYDRLSPQMAEFLEGLTATHDASFFHDEARRLGNPLRKGVRGSPLNHGEDLKAVHPVIRTNREFSGLLSRAVSIDKISAVTGWKSVYVNKGFTKRINGVTKDESDMLLQYLFNLVTQNHDAQVRFKWNKNDMAIWDNRSTWHCATYDYVEARAGDRVCSLGEAPYLDIQSKSRRQALAA